MLDRLHQIYRHYFTPHHSNNYRARFLHGTYFIVYVMLLISVQTSVSWVTRLNPDILGYATDISIEKVLDLVNNERIKNNLIPLELSTELTMAATNKASDMFKDNYWAHISPTGTTPWSFITGSGYKYIYAGENLAKNFDSSKNVVEAWMNSPTHRANILKPEYKEIGLAVMNGKLQGDETTLVVQEFGSRSTSIAKIIPTEEVKSQKPLTQGSTDLEVIDESQQISPLRITKKLSLYIAEFLLIILCIDAIYMWKNKTARISGHSLAHIIFIAALIGAMGATGVGVIL